MKKRLDRKIAISLIIAVPVISVAAVIFLFRSPIGAYFNGVFHKSIPISPEVVAVIEKTEAPEPEVSQNLAETKEAITKEPPKHPTSTGITGKTTQNSDGSKTTVVSDAGGSCPDLPSLASRNPTGTSPNNIEYSDKTGSYPSLGSTLKSYLSTNLLWSNEIGSMYKIVLEDAGNTGWEGQYCGAYSMTSKGDIVASYGYIILNTYYHKSSSVFTDYMKLTLSHEYGHHYTLSHKWIDLDLAANARFPDSYYSVRPLSKTTTATDYSKGWQNCDAEIVAEDYSYFYSGYGMQQMNISYGLALPSAGTKNWIQNLSSAQNSGGEAEAQIPATDQTPPTVSISQPSSGATLSGTFTFTASASDNIGVAKVGFYLNGTLLAEDGTAPYETSINTGSYDNGSYTLKAVAYDSKQSAETSVSVTFENAPDAEKPVVTITTPSTNPYSWVSGDLIIEARATDNKRVARMELFVNDQSVANRNGAYIGVSFAWFEGNFTNYIFKVKAYDAEGNVGEATVTISK